jgi:3-oxoacyl-[acyl-carrier protein] reductase
MNLGIKGKTALVTGASAGLGFAAAAALAAEGANLIINSRSEERISEAAERIRTAVGVKPVAIAADLATDDGLAVVRSFAEKNSIDILVSNIGGPPPGPFLDHPRETWEMAYRLLLVSAVELTRSILTGMIERGFGRLIYITSVAVLQPIDDLILSNTYRAGLTGFCKTISNNYARHGITANCVCPGYTRTERLQALAENRATATGKTPKEVLDGLADTVPARRLGQPGELAALIAFLAGEKAAYITGTSIGVDGGANRSLI